MSQDEFRKSYEHLKDENTVLRDQVDTSVENELTLRVSLQLFRGLIETAPSAIIVLNDQGIVELANEQSDQMFGYDKGELPGLAVEAMLPKWFHRGYLRNVLDHAANGDGRAVVEHIATTAKRKDQSEFPVAASLNATPSPRGLLVTCILRDEGGNLGLGSEEPVAYPSPRAVRLR